MIRLRYSMMTLISAVAACDGSNSDVMAVPDAAVDRPVAVDGTAAVDVAAPDVAPPDDTATDASVTDVSKSDATSMSDVPPTEMCPANAPDMMHTGDINADETWDCTRTHVLGGDGVFVRNNAVLTLRPGTVIKGGSQRAALVITTTGRIDARGTAAQPIVFTSAMPVGMRRSAQWGGVVLLGNARINSANTMADGGVSGTPGTNQIEGIPPTDGRARYGGTDDDHNCGTLRYVRIEFPGYELSANNELNGLTMGGCGRRTLIDYVEVFDSADDGVEIFGGTVDIKHVLIVNAEDDGLDWDFGWTGRAQFVAVHSPRTSTESDPNGIEADNEPRVFSAMPVSDPLLYNVTLRGPGAMNGVTVGYRAIVLRRGTAGRFYNTIVTGYPTQAIDLRDAPTLAFARATPPRLFANHSIFFGNNPSRTQFADDGADMFDEDAFFLDPARMNRAIDPMLPTYSDRVDLVPAATSPATTGGAMPPNDGFFEQANYVGAFPPGAPTHWATGWTAFPSN